MFKDLKLSINLNKSEKKRRNESGVRSESSSDHATRVISRHRRKRHKVNLNAHDETLKIVLQTPHRLKDDDLQAAGCS